MADREGVPLANENRHLQRLSGPGAALIDKGVFPALAKPRDGRPPRFMRMTEVCRRTGYGPRQIYRMIAEGRFPKGHRQSHKVAVWYETDVDAWQTERMIADLLS